jgi:hypothetical protein
VKLLTQISLLLALGALGSLCPLRAQDLAVADDPSMDFTTTGTDAPVELPQILPEVPPDAPSQLAAPTTPDEASDLDQSLYGEDQMLADASPEPTAQGRPWKLNLHASVGSRYDDNIFITSTHPASDFVTRLTAGGGFTLGDYSDKKGDYLISDYTGIGEIFDRHGNEDAYEQNATLQGQAIFAHLTLQGNLQFQDLADEDIDIGARARRQIYTGDFTLRYDISDKTFLEATAQLTDANYDLYLDSNDERGGLSFNYLPDPTVIIGLGAMGGVLNVQDSGSQTYEQFLASTRINFTGKFTLKAGAGVEDRQLTDGGSFVTPVFQLAGDYSPTESTDLTLSAYRQVANSAYYSGADYIDTGVSAGARYDLSSRFSVLLGGGFDNTAYRDVATGARIARTDNYYFIRPGLRYTASPYCNVELYYIHRQDASTLATSSFTNNQVGVTLNFAF